MDLSRDDTLRMELLWASVPGTTFGMADIVPIKGEGLSDFDLEPLLPAVIFIGVGEWVLNATDSSAQA